MRTFLRIVYPVSILGDVFNKYMQIGYVKPDPYCSLTVPSRTANKIANTTQMLPAFKVLKCHNAVLKYSLFTTMLLRLFPGMTVNKENLCL